MTTTATVDLPEPQFVIFDKAHGLLQWEGTATDEDAAFRAFGDVLGYSAEEPGVFTRDAYRVEAQ